MGTCRPPSAEEPEEFLPGQTGVSDKRSQQTSTKLPVPGDREPRPAGPMDHVAALPVPFKADLGHGLDKLVARDEGKTRHYTGTSKT